MQNSLSGGIVYSTDENTTLEKREHMKFFQHRKNSQAETKTPEAIASTREAENKNLTLAIRQMAKYQKEQIARMMEEDYKMIQDIQEIQDEFGGIMENMDVLDGSIDDFQNNFHKLSETVNQYRDYQKRVHEVIQSAKERVAVFSLDSEKMMGSFEGLDSSFKELEEAIESIRTSASGIEAVAEQTSLLSLNASIEAARAGEAGKGFAVVASEVQSLSQEIQQLVDRVNSSIQLVNSSISKMNDSVSSSKGMMTANLDNTKRIDEDFSHIIDETNKIEDINKEIVDMSKGADGELLRIKDFVKESNGSYAKAGQFIAQVESNTKSKGIMYEDINNIAKQFEVL